MEEQTRTLSLAQVLKLRLNDITPEHLSVFPGMTGWFKPILLAKLLLNVIVSEMFGQYADRRLVHAALDKQTPEEARARSDVSEELRREDGDVWIDYIADLGDGFDATYAMAYLLAQPDIEVEIDGRQEILPRAGALFMGGDEVYPTASRPAYNAQLMKPYSLAWPDTREPDGPPLFALPGNHDWYDGLVVFLAIFCRVKSSRIGNWRTRQRRSYFSARVAENWWVWGIDIALVRDMDQPQADYFVDAAEHMPNNANIILCSAEPGWYDAEGDGDSFRTLDYAASILLNAKKDLRIPLILSGDSHHYARYTGAKSQFITAGGGGAFVHGTLNLQPEIQAKWLKVDDTLKLSVAYPTQAQSKTLLDAGTSFFAKNPEFSYTLGIVYWIFAFVLTSLWRVDVAIILYLTLAVVFWGYFRYSENAFSWITLFYSVGQATAHALAIGAIAAAGNYLQSEFLPPLHWFFRASLLFIFAVPIGARLGALIFGQYLRLTCKYAGKNHNDAFSAMKLDSYRNFLRIRIRGDEVTVYPIGVDSIPKRDDWKLNEKRSPQHPSIFEPAEASLRHRLIEKPININAAATMSSSDVEVSHRVISKQ